MVMVILANDYIYALMYHYGYESQYINDVHFGKLFLIMDYKDRLEYMHAWSTVINCIQMNLHPPNFQVVAKLTSIFVEGKLAFNTYTAIMT